MDIGTERVGTVPAETRDDNPGNDHLNAELVVVDGWDWESGKHLVAMRGWDNDEENNTPVTPSIFISKDNAITLAGLLLRAAQLANAPATEALTPDEERENAINLAPPGQLAAYRARIEDGWSQDVCTCGQEHTVPHGPENCCDCGILHIPASMHQQDRMQ
jgi:hypothetical protein